MLKPTLVLASASKGRKTILSTLKISFLIVDSNVDENKIQNSNPKNLVIERARIKGEAVEKLLFSNSPKSIPARSEKIGQPITKSYLIIAADSMVVSGKKVIGKNPTAEEQKNILLKSISGKTHEFITGIWIKNTETGKIWKNIGKSRVTIRKLNTKEVEDYIARDDLSKYAGAYSLFNSPQNFVTKVEGSLTNIVGLPLEIVMPILTKNNLL